MKYLIQTQYDMIEETAYENTSFTIVTHIPSQTVISLGTATSCKLGFYFDAGQSTASELGALFFLDQNLPSYLFSSFTVV